MIRGWAPEASGAMTAKDGGMASSLVGNNVGEMKGLLARRLLVRLDDAKEEGKELTASGDEPSERDYRRSGMRRAT